MKRKVKNKECNGIQVMLLFLLMRFNTFTLKNTFIVHSPSSDHSIDTSAVPEKLLRCWDQKAAVSPTQLEMWGKRAQLAFTW